MGYFLKVGKYFVADAGLRSLSKWSWMAFTFEDFPAARDSALLVHFRRKAAVEVCHFKRTPKSGLITSVIQTVGIDDSPNLAETI